MGNETSLFVTISKFSDLVYNRDPAWSTLVNDMKTMCDDALESKPETAELTISDVIYSIFRLVFMKNFGNIKTDDETFIVNVCKSLLPGIQESEITLILSMSMVAANLLYLEVKNPDLPRSINALKTMPEDSLLSYVVARLIMLRQLEILFGTWDSTIIDYLVTKLSTLTPIKEQMLVMFLGSM